MLDVTLCFGTFATFQKDGKAANSEGAETTDEKECG